MRSALANRCFFASCVTFEGTRKPLYSMAHQARDLCVNSEWNSRTSWLGATRTFFYIYNHSKCLGNAMWVMNILRFSSVRVRTVKVNCVWSALHVCVLRNTDCVHYCNWIQMFRCATEDVRRCVGCGKSSQGFHVSMVIKWVYVFGRK